MKHPSIIKFQTCVIILILLYMGMPQELLSQNIAVKSNMLYNLTTTLNVGGEFRCGKNETIHLNLNYNPWEFGNNKNHGHPTHVLPALDTAVDALKMSPQEYLDRQDRYDLIFFLTSTGELENPFLCQQIMVNGWIVRLNEAELEE